MKYKVSVIKLVTLVMIGALAVAMVACTGAATGPEGPEGPQGPPGPAAPTPDPADPAEPTTPEPAGPTGAAPMLSTPFPVVYLALEGDGNPPSKVIDLDAHITDADSRVKFSVMSSDPMIATATPPEGGRTVTITPKRVGTVIVTVTARDGDNPPLMEDISVTVVRRNDRPTTNDLSKADRDELEMKLYVNDGARTDTVTVAVTPGGTSMEEVEDSISGFDVKYGADKAKTSKHVAVSVVRVGTTDQYVITVTPTKASLGMPAEKIMIYPKDMFGAPSSEAWEFMAKFNTPPDVLDGSFGTKRLTRPSIPDSGTAVTVDAMNAVTIKISDYFKDLERMVKPGALDATAVTALNNATTTAPDAAEHLAKIDEVGDTVCEVTVSTNLAIVQLLNEAGAEVDGTTEVASSRVLKASAQALGAIRIDSRRSAYGKDKLFTAANTADNIVTPADESENNDTPATGEGDFDISIRCTDKDHTAEVTGRVVIKSGS